MRNFLRNLFKDPNVLGLTHEERDTLERFVKLEIDLEMLGNALRRGLSFDFRQKPKTLISSYDEYGPVV